MEVDIIHPLVDGQSCEEFNNYVTLDVNVTAAFQMARNFASK